MPGGRQAGTGVRGKGLGLGGWDQLVSGAVTLGAVVLGGWLTARVSVRQSRTEHERGWRAVRLDRYVAFLSAYREYVAFLLDPASTITAVPHPRLPGEQMPFFDEAGRPYRERLEATKTAVFLTCGSAQVKTSAQRLTRQARRLAAARHEVPATALPPEDFERLWALESVFVNAARRDLGLPPLPRGSGVDVDAGADADGGPDGDRLPGAALT